jgi:hypothetical protein
VKFDAFVGPTYCLAAVAADAQRAQNLIPEVVQSGTGKAKVVFRLTPGIHTFTTLPTAPLRELWAGDQRLFAVAGSKLYEVFSDGSATQRGDVGDDASHSPALMFPNGNQLWVVSADQAYIDNGSGPEPCRFEFGYTDLAIDSVDSTKVSSEESPFVSEDVGENLDITGGTGFTVQTVTILAVDENGVATVSASLGTPGSTGGAGTQWTYVNARTGCFLDSYFIAALAQSKKYYLSAPNDGTSWDPLDFNTKEAYPDNIARVIADHEELWLLGDQTSECWRNEGDEDTVFRRDPSGFIPKGCVARWSAVNLDDGPAWLGGGTEGQPVAYRAKGFTPVRVSTHAIEEAWQSYSTVADAIGYTYVDGGHTFWVLTFPTGNATWVYDLNTELWHERGWWNGSSIDRHRGRCHAFTWGKHFVGDHTTGQIYEMSREFFDDDGVDIHRVRVAPHLADENKNIAYHRIELDVHDPGGKHSAATVAWSSDGGTTYNTPRVADSSTARTKKLRRMVWRRLGASRVRTFRATFTQQHDLTLIGANLEFTPGIS